MLHWNHIQGEYVLALQQGKAVIREDERDGSKVYKPHIKDNRGHIVARFEPGFDDFEMAEVFVSVNLIELDRVGIDDAKFREKLVAALNACLEVLSQPNRAFHRRRIENIQRWLLRQTANRDPVDAPTADWNNHVFNWQPAGSSFQCHTPPHGKAIIAEVSLSQRSSLGTATTARYGVEIADSTGVILKDYYVPSVDFLSAEARLREILSELEQPFVDEVYVDQLTFTLQICERLLPEDTDLMQIVRLRHIDSYLGEVLP